MRVIAGTARGRRLLCPAGRGTRPTPDRVREALFSMLGEAVRGARVLDLFAGTGALGIEALSRGAVGAVFVESGRAALTILRRNLDACGMAGLSRVVEEDAVAFLGRGLPPGIGLVFADPPYAGPEGPEALRLLGADARKEDILLVVYQHSPRTPPPVPPGLAAVDHRRYGETGLLLLKPAGEGD